MDNEQKNRGYVTEIEGYSGPVDKISPYHYYMHTYFKLRQKWREALYEWTRREPCDAKARISPEQVLAGKRETLEITVTLGETPLLKGGRVAVFFPLDFGSFGMRNSLMCYQGPEGMDGYGARITSKVSKGNAVLKTIVHSTGAVFTCVEVVVEEGGLQEGEQMKIIIGDPSCKPQIINEGAKTYPLRTAIDYQGNDEFKPVLPNPEVRVVGNSPVNFRCFAPATPDVGEKFALKVIASDIQNHNASWHYEGKISIEAIQGTVDAEKEFDFKKEHHGFREIQNVAVADGGTTRILVMDKENGLLGISNPICPKAAPKGFKLYYGEIHSHTEISDGVGTADDNFLWARDIEGLDFAALADHFEDIQSYNYTLEDKWSMTKKAVEKYNEPGKFVTLLGYEIGTLEQHRNVYFPDAQGRMIVQGPGGERVTMDNVFGKLEGTDYLLIPHAPKFHGINWHTPNNPDRQRLVEICSFWGISEEGGPLSVRHALDLGYKFGFTGGTDSHLAEPGNPNQGGITGVYAKSLSRKDIFEALINRRTFATSGPRMIISFHVNDALMGEEKHIDYKDCRLIKAHAVTTHPMKTVDIVRNGEVVHRIDGGNKKELEITWEDTDNLEGLMPKRELTDEKYVYYYIRVCTVDGNYGWSSPVWLHAGE